MNRRPIVLHVVEAFGGGVFNSVAQLCQGLQDEFQFVVLHSRRESTPENFRDFFPEDTIFVPWRVGRAVNLREDLGTARRQLRTVVQTYQPVCIHAHSSKAGGVARLAYPFGGHRVYYTPRAYGFLQLTDPWYKRWAYWAMEWALAQLPHITIACGAGEYELAKQFSSRSGAIFNTIDIPAVLEQIGDVPKNPDFTVVGVGRISPQKNFNQFVELAQLCRDVPIQFQWLGGPVPETGAHGQPLPPNLTITGWLEHTAVLQKLAAAHVYVQCSLWEGLPRTVLEAMAVGTLTLVSNTIGNRELVKHGEDGFMCDSTKEFKFAIANVFNTPELAADLALNARRKIAQDYNPAAALHRWSALYRSGVIPRPEVRYGR